MNHILSNFSGLQRCSDVTLSLALKGRMSAGQLVNHTLTVQHGGACSLNYSDHHNSEDTTTQSLFSKQSRRNQTNKQEQGPGGGQVAGGGDA